MQRCILHTLMVLADTETLVEYVYVSKGHVTTTCGSSEPFYMLRLMGMSVPSLHIEIFTDSLK